MTTATITPGITLPLAAARLSRPDTASTHTRRTRLRMTARGRRAAAVIAALPLVFGVFLGILSGGAASASRGVGVAGASFETVSVQPGDTLWSIAVDVAPASDPRDVIDAIKRLNVLDSAAVTSGQRLAIPAEYAP